jgi:DNA-binding IclR family transcriptional regulator
LAQSNKAEDKEARAPREELRRMLATIDAEGYATHTTTRHLTEETSLSVPVMVGQELFAVLSIRHAGSGLQPKTAVERFLPKLRHSAGKLVQSVMELKNQADATVQSMPGAAA